jgi:hypothetical protein
VHAARAADAARRLVQPRDAAGRPDPTGTVVLLSVGMSNTTQEFSRFVQLTGSDPDLASSLVVVDGAQGGRAVDDWIAPDTDVWTEVARRLDAAGVAAAQVQVAWIKHAERQPARFGTFPVPALALRDDLHELVRQLHDRFPNLRLAFLSSRIYAGYATTQLNPEPHAYESAFSVRWLVEQQTSGDPSLNADADAGPVEAPLLLWGPYLWADGLVPRSDGLTWRCEDFAADGTHPGPAARDVVAGMLLAFFGSDPAARPWFLRPVDLRVSRAGDDVMLRWSGARAPWRVESADGETWTVLATARDAPDHVDAGAALRPGLTFYRVF